MQLVVLHRLECRLTSAGALPGKLFRRRHSLTVNGALMPTEQRWLHLVPENGQRSCWGRAIDPTLPAPPARTCPTLTSQLVQMQQLLEQLRLKCCATWPDLLVDTLPRQVNLSRDN